MKKKLLALLMGTSLALAACGGADYNAEKDTTTNNGNETTTADAGDAAKLYENKCSACHGQELSGGGAPDLTKVGSRLSEDEIATVIKEGRGGMPGGLLDETETAQMSEWLATKK